MLHREGGGVCQRDLCGKEPCVCRLGMAGVEGEWVTGGSRRQEGGWTRGVW